MFIVRTKPTEWLFTNLRYYKTFTDLQKSQIFYIANKNLIYSIKEKTEKVHALSLLNNMQKSSSAVDEVKKYVRSTIRRDIDEVNLKSWDDIVRLYDMTVQNLTVCSDFISALIMNTNLYESGLCPFLLYAFNDWQWGLNYPNRLERLVEFSFMYLYRFVPKNVKTPCGNFQPLHLLGATSNVFIDKDNRVICKVPKNLAAILYLIPQEYENVCLLRETPLGQFCSENYKYDNQYQYLYHRAVLGNSGEDLLFNHTILCDAQIKSLKKFYSLYSNRNDKQMILDIHPGNFVWDDSKEQWYLVDLGSLPDIGKEYYEYSTFEQYFLHIWINRERNMRIYPIRSIDLNMDEVIYTGRYEE
ncbi:MAG: hypothetical protein GX941_09880 [Candidatus Methanofastidiosa archaeon]|nr:hypothetical protein [Candidatus Methanofastidiosa archaeon]